MPVFLTFKEHYEDDPAEDPAPDNFPILVAEIEGWPDPPIVHPLAGSRPRDGEAWSCAVDEAGWVWPVEKMEKMA